MSGNEKNELKCNEMAVLADSFLRLDLWHFHESARLTVPHPIVIYDSEWCRVKLLWEGWDMYTGDTVIVYYGRSNAVNDKFTMLWNGEECYCWHHINEPLYFLDGMAPFDASKRKWPHFIEQFADSEIIKNIPSQPQRQLMMHAAIWNHYGSRIFELFDMRHSDTWEQYTDFLKKYYELKGTGPIPIIPPQYKVC